jgi:hypothetical protein
VVVVVVSSAINIIILVAGMVVPPPSISRPTKGPIQLQRCLILPISNLRARSSISHSNNNSSRVNIVLNPNSHQMATSRAPSNILRKEHPELPKVAEVEVVEATKTPRVATIRVVLPINLSPVKIST